MSVATAAMQAYRQVGNQGLSSNRLVLLGLDGILEYLRNSESLWIDPHNSKVNKKY